jgi:hypothetical protein
MIFFFSCYFYLKNTTFNDIKNQEKTCGLENKNSTVNCGDGGFFPFGFAGLFF